MKRELEALLYAAVIFAILVAIVMWVGLEDTSVTLRFFVGVLLGAVSYPIGCLIVVIHHVNRRTKLPH